jgi:hypothetical protein
LIEFSFPNLPEYSRWLPERDTTTKIAVGKEYAPESKARAAPRCVLLFSGHV